MAQVLLVERQWIYRTFDIHMTKAVAPMQADFRANHASARFGGLVSPHGCDIRAQLSTGREPTIIVAVYSHALSVHLKILLDSSVISRLLVD